MLHGCLLADCGNCDCGRSDVEGNECLVDAVCHNPCQPGAAPKTPSLLVKGGHVGPRRDV